MSCFPCFGSKNSEEEVPAEVPVAQVVDTNATPPATPHAVSDPPNLSADVGREPNATGDSNSRTFTFRELLMATKNFKQESLIGEGGFGKLHKGKLQSGEVVAVKHLDRGGTQGSKEFLVEVLILTLLNHQNLVKLIGYCADGDQRLLVYEYMSFGSLDVHLHDISDDKKPLDWQTRMKIASGVAQGLEYLHEKANPPVFYRDLKPANILLDEDYNPRLSGYGIAKLVNGDTKMHASPRVMGTYGYCAPEYERQGELTAKSDVYSFGVILLELITGRRALDTTRPTDEQNLVSWAQPFFRDQKRFPEMADPLLQGRIPQKCLNQAIGMAAMCLQEEPSVRPLTGDVLSMLSFLEVAPPEEAMPASLQAAPSKSEINGNESEDDKGSSSSDDESDDGSVSSDNDEDHPEDQNECTEKPSPNQSRKFEKQDTSSQHKYKTKAKSEQKGSKKSLYSIGRKSLHDNDSCDGGSSHHSLKNYDDNEFLEGNVHESSLSNSKTEWSDGIAPQNSMNNATPQGHVSMNLRKNSVEGSEGGSIGSSIGHGGYDGSFVWSIGSSTDYQLQDGSARRNSGCISNADIRNDIHGLSMRQQSIPNS